jgi:hypothetical protein
MLPTAPTPGCPILNAALWQTVSAQSNSVGDHSAGPMRTTVELSKVLWTIQAGSRAAGRRSR